MTGRVSNGTLDGATNIAASVLREFGADIDAHLRGECERCAAGQRQGDPPFAVGTGAL